MSLADKYATPTESKSISLDDFLSEMSQPKEEFVQEPAAIEENIQSDFQQQQNLDDIKKRSRTAAKFITNTLDKALSWGACEVALADLENMSDFGADDEAKSELVDYWAIILEGWQGNIPPWLMLAITYPVVYGPIFREAFKARAINQALIQKNAEKEAENEILKAKIAKMEAEKKKENENT